MLNTHPTPSRPGTARCLARAGFTAADLLAVVAVLCVLAAVLAPMARRARSASNLARCTSNLGQVGKAILSYAQDHNDQLPDVVRATPPEGWWAYKEVVKSYAGLTGPSSPADKVFACPEDRGYAEEGAIAPFRRGARYNHTSYVFNGVNLPGVPNIAGRALGSIQDPQRTLLVMEWAAHAPVSWHRSRTGRANVPFYNDAECVVTFADGRTKLVKIYYDGINPAFTRDPIPGYAYKYSGD